MEIRKRKTSCEKDNEEEKSTLLDSKDPVPPKFSDEELKLIKRQIRKKKWVKRLQYLSNKIQAFGWVAGACYCLYMSNFFRVIWEHPAVNRLFFNITLCGIGIFISIILYLAIYLPYIARVREEWEVYCPNIIPTMTVVVLMSFITANMALWPVWGIFTFPLLIIFLAGFIFANHFIPGGLLGTLIQILIIIGAAMTAHYIPHEGKWHY